MSASSPLYQSVCLSVHLFICLFDYLFICLFVRYIVHTHFPPYFTVCCYLYAFPLSSYTSDQERDVSAALLAKEGETTHLIAELKKNPHKLNEINSLTAHGANLLHDVFFFI